MTDRWTEQLSDYVDDLMSPALRVECEDHLASCVACRGIVADLRALVNQAQSLPDTPPATDLWPGIAERLTSTPLRLAEGGVPAAPARPRASWRFNLPQLAAAGLAFALMGGAGTAWLLRNGATPVAVEPAVVSAMPTAALPGEASWSKAVEDLRGALEQGRGQLDPKTVETLERSLATIDRAITEAREALKSDPANPYLNNHLQDTMRRKLELMRQAAALVTQS